MPVVECESCRRRYQVNPNLVGKPVRCRQCGKAFLAKPYGMDPTRTSMTSGSRGQSALPPEEPLLSADAEDLDELFAAAEAAPKANPSPAKSAFIYNNPLDIHAVPSQQVTPPAMPPGRSRTRWWAPLVVIAIVLAILAALIWVIVAATSSSTPPVSLTPPPRTSRPPVDPPRPTGPVFVLPSPPPGAETFAVESLPTLAPKADDIVLNQLRHAIAIGPYMFRPPAGHTLRGRRDGEQPEVQFAGGEEIAVRDATTVPAQRMNVVVVPLSAAKFKSADEMLQTPPARFQRGTVNGMPFVVTYDVRSLTREKHSFVINYQVFTGPHVVTFEIIAAERFDQGIHRELALSVHTLQPLDVVLQAMGDVAKGDVAERTAGLRRLAAAPPTASDARRDRVVAAATAAMRAPDAAMRTAAVEVAGAWMEPKDRLDALLPMLMDGDQAVRDQAIRLVGETGDDRAVQPVANAFEKSPGAAGRALKALGAKSEKAVLELLRKYADSSAMAGNLFDVMDSIATAASLEDIRQLARSDKRPVAERARKILKKLDKDFDAVTEALLDLDPPGGSHVKEAVDLLVGTKPDGRRDKVVEALMAVAFENGDGQTADRAADVLATWGTAELVPRLAEVLSKETEVLGPPRRAIIILAGLKDPRGVAPVVLWIVKLRELAVESLKQMGPVAEDEVLKLLRDKRASVRRDACMILGVIGSEKAISPIQLLINDRQPEVPEAAKAALEAIRARRPK